MQRCYQLFVRQDFEECLTLIEDLSGTISVPSDFLLCIKGLIYRQQGEVQQSLQLFQQAAALNPNSHDATKQVARTLHLLARYQEAIETYEEVEAALPADWEVLHHKGLCYASLGDHSKATDVWLRAISIQPRDATQVELIKSYMQLGNTREALQTGVDALEVSPENGELLSLIGMLYMQKGEVYRAFDLLGSALALCPRDTRTILAAGSIMQDHSDYDVALMKYRVAAVHAPNSPQLWNNIGMCLLGQQKYVAAISCLKKALYLGPFEWMISHNLGIVHLCTQQFASAFHYFSASINLNPVHAHSYMYMGMALAKLDDFENACHAYDKAVQLGGDMLIHLNYAVTLYTHDEHDAARQHALQVEELFKTHPESPQCSESRILQHRERLAVLLAPDSL
ncbi:hypothetical protein WJX72_001332 [[Myrmecia] bisecta]|uniref:Bardet-Biedl syndrome 4 n=1 Tax=[Myrmecia] bisecta TaxID=41462 RepID=A0AAW1QP39_9CHLO